MSFLSEVTNNIVDLWGAVTKRGRRIAVLERRIETIARENAQLRTMLGEASYGPFQYSPPAFPVQIESYLASGNWSARRIAPEHVSFDLDVEDEELYQVQATPWVSGVFPGARGFVTHSHNVASLIPADNGITTAIYTMREGEWNGFKARTAGAATTSDGLVYYPWTQVGELPGYHYTSSTVIDPDGINFEFGPAQYCTQAGYDTVNSTYERVGLPAGTPCIVWYDGFDNKFMLMQMSERIADLCP